LLEPGARILAAVSGGSDSIALLTLLSDVSSDMRLSLAAAHFDHGIRVEAAAREKTLVERHASRLNVPVLFGSADVPAVSRKSKNGIEETARILRLDFLERSAAEWNADSVALGHTRDDQVETVLHHIIRGAGFRGITGIPERRGIFIRPLLGFSRGELIEYLRGRGIRYAVDSSNRDNTLLRNRIRNRLLPYLRKHFNPSVDESILRLRENLKEGWEILEGTVSGMIITTGGGTAVELPLDSARVLNDFQLYLLIDSILRDGFSIYQDVGKIHFDTAKKLIRSGRSGSSTDFPHGVTMFREQEHIRFARKKPAGTGGDIHEELLIPSDGDYILTKLGYSISLRTMRARSAAPYVAGDHEAFLSAVKYPVRVRSRRPGDRMVPFGMKGRKKLSDLFIDRKIPLHKRDRFPVFEDERGIFWVPGVAAGERARITPSTRTVTHIRLSKL